MPIRRQRTRAPCAPWFLCQFTTKSPGTTYRRGQATQFSWRRPQSILDCTRRIHGACLYFRPIECVRHLPSVVCFTPTATPACIDDILDWILTIMGILFLCTFLICSYFILTSHPNAFFNPQGATIGRLFDAHGPTRLMVAGTLCCLISTMTTSVCREYYQYILSQGILFGLGVGLLYVHLWMVR